MRRITHALERKAPTMIRSEVFQTLAVTGMITLALAATIVLLSAIG